MNSVVRLSGALRPVVGSLVGLFVGLGAFWWSLSAARLGHGTYIPAAILFPYSMIVAVPISNIGSALIAFALIQFPVYGALIALSARPRTTGLILGGVHFSAAVIACILTATSENCACSGLVRRLRLLTRR
jgi:hypothetical protein